MHLTAKDTGKNFFTRYSVPAGSVIVDVGSMEVCMGSLREVAPADCRYIGVDLSEGPGVDVVADDPYSLPLDSESVDVVISTSTFEHVEMFWLLFIEMVRIAKRGGLIYVNAPSNGPFHQYPVDCWRFYLDAGSALVKWAARQGYEIELLETEIGEEGYCDVWKDWMCVWRRV